MSLACVDGVVMPVAEASIPATDEGLLRGDGVFEVVRLYGGRAFALEHHLERLTLSAANLRLEIELGALRAEIATLLGAAGDHDGALRIVATRGGARVLLTEPPPEAAQPALSLASITYAPTRVLDGVKSLSYAPNVLARRLARERGADEALLVTPHGRVLEAPTATLFWVAGGELLTPPLVDHILASITRRYVLELCDGGERECTLAQLADAEEAFLASTTREVQAVRAIDGSVLDAPGPLTARAAQLLRARIASELADG